jgi:hypothetical protein
LRTVTLACGESGRGEHCEAEKEMSDLKCMMILLYFWAKIFSYE